MRNPAATRKWSICNEYAQKSSPKSLAVTLQVDGGLPIKKFIAGDDVFPNLTDMLETECTC